MGIPVVGEIWDGIRWAISEFLDKAPRPLKFLLFMLFLVALVSIIPFFLHVFGFHCNTDLEAVQVSPLKMSKNVQLAFMGEDDIINTSSYTPQTIDGDFYLFTLPLEACLRRICFHNGEAYYAIEDECENETILTPFALDSGTYSWVRCADCELGYFNSTFIRGSLGASETKNLCFGDAYARNESDYNWLQDLVCDPSDRCIPPENYYYEYDTGTYDCNNLDVCGLNNTEIVSSVDTILKDAEGVLMYDNPDGRAYDNMMMIKCDAKLRPQITFFGIPVFDYRIWLMITVIFTMFSFLKNIRAH